VSHYLIGISRFSGEVVTGVRPYSTELSLARSVTQLMVAVLVLTSTVGPSSRLAGLVNLPVGSRLTTLVKAPQLLAESQAWTL